MDLINSSGILAISSKLMPPRATCQVSTSRPPLGRTPSATAMARSMVRTLENGRNSITTLTPKGWARSHNRPKVSRMRGTSGGPSSNRPAATLRLRAPSSPATSSNSSRILSDAARRSPSRCQSVRNSTSRCLIPLSWKMLRTVEMPSFSTLCMMSACTRPMPRQPAFDAACARACRENGLISLGAPG
ncbi:hypothetical protein D3C73_1177750 [compost metagenome]